MNKEDAASSPEVDLSERAELLAGACTDIDAFWVGAWVGAKVDAWVGVEVGA
jgi:hypothetical protein